MKRLIIVFFFISAGLFGEETGLQIGNAGEGRGTFTFYDVVFGSGMIGVLIWGLVGCEWSVTGEATISYNCIAWTVGITDKWVNAIGITGLGNNRYYISIDTSYGNGDGIMTMDELDAFYDANGYTVTDSSSADIMYYSKYHGARKKRCSDGAGKWEMFESKCGALERIEHLRDQLNGDSYGFPVRYYKAK